jgi:hypothetical protein
MTGLVGPQRAADGDEATVRVGSSGEIIVQDLNGRYAEQAQRGNVFIYSTPAAGIALIVAAMTGGHPTLWNPAGSGYNWIPLCLYLGYVSGNNAPGSLSLHNTANAGSAIGTAAPVVTFTDVAPVNALLGSPKATKMRWAPAVNTYAAVPSHLMSTGVSLFTGVAATAVAPFTLVVPFDGALIVGPGNALSLCSIQATTTALFVVSWLGIEVPIPNYA